MLPRFSRSVSLLALSFLLSPLSDFQADARWATEDEVNVECLKAKTTVKVLKDGSFTMESETQLKVLTETGRQALSTQIFTYDARGFTMDILEAKTNSMEQEFMVPMHKIENKPLASDSQGLTKNHQILIPFEQVVVGSIVSVKFIQTCFKPQFENYFSTSLTFGQNYLWKNSEVIIESELPLLSKINDPRNSLNVIEKNDNFHYVMKVDLNKPILEALVGESNNSYVEPSLYTSVFISTEKDYERIGKLKAKSYQPILTGPLPEKLESIRNIASKIEDETDCIDTVVTYLIENITYLGIWDSLEGATIPRALEEIMSSGYGDCKEYSACLVAILNKLGYQAKIAIINRSDVYLEEETLPNFQKFNHAIAKAIGPSGKTYWIDSTNNVTMANGIFPDIADRPVLVLDPENPTYERVPPIDYRHAKCNYDRIFTILEDGNIYTEGSFFHEGESAQNYIELFNLHSFSTVKEAILKSLGANQDLINSNLDIIEPISRIVKPLKATFCYEEDHAMIHTNFGEAFPLRNNWHKRYLDISQQNESALYVGHPETIIKKSNFKNVSAEHLDKLVYSLQTPWLNTKRDISVTHEGIIITETIEKLKSIIPANDLKSEEYRKLKNTLRKYCDGVAIIFSPKVMDL